MTPRLTTLKTYVQRIDAELGQELTRPIIDAARIEELRRHQALAHDVLERQLAARDAARADASALCW